MNKKTIIGLAVICGVLFAGYSLTNLEKQKPSDSDELATGFRPFEKVNFAQVETIRISDHSATTHLVRAEGQWGVEQKNGYPSDFEKLSTFVRSLPEKEIGQEMASGETYLGEYGLSETGEDKPTTLVFETETGDSLLELVAGKRRERGGQFVQLDSGVIVLLNEALSDLSSNPDQWIDRNLIDLSETDIESFTVNTDEENYTLKVVARGQYELEDLKEGETLKQFEPGRLGRAFERLLLISVFPADEEGMNFGFEGEETLLAKTKDGRVYTAQLGSVSEDLNNRYLKLSVEFNAPEGPSIDEVALELTKKAKEEAAGEAVDDEALISEIAKAHAERLATHEKEIGDLQAQVDEQNAKWSPWVFTVMNFNADSMTLERSSIVEVQEDAEESSPVE